MTEIQTEKHQCAGKVSRPPAFLKGTPFLCRRLDWESSRDETLSRLKCLAKGRTTYYEDGRWWCSFHAPSKVRARRQKQIDEADLEWEKLLKKRRQLASFPRLLAAAEAVLLELDQHYGRLPLHLETELRNAVNQAKGPI